MEANNNSMYMVLKYIIDNRSLLDFCHNNLSSKTWKDWDKVYYFLRDIIDMAMEAVEVKPRNCDVGTAEERMYRYNRLRDEINDRYKRLGEIPPAFAFPTAFEWEDRPYEEGGAE